MFPCKNCPVKYIGQTQTRPTEEQEEHQYARHEHSSLPDRHRDGNGHQLDCMVSNEMRMQEKLRQVMPARLKKRGIVWTNKHL
jgi:hypothetical protein